MTKNQKRKYFALSMMILGIVILIALALCRVLYGIKFGTLQYVIVPLVIGFFFVVYRNFSQAVKEDEKYGPLEWNNMEKEKNHKIVIDANKICLVAGIMNALCLIYCLIEAIFYNDSNFFAITTSALMSLYFLWFSLKK